MPNPMYKWQMPTEQYKDKIAELKEELDKTMNEYQRLLDEQAHRIANLEQRDAILTALENGGVDNWEGYDVALDEMRSADE